MGACFISDPEKYMFWKVGREHPTDSCFFISFRSTKQALQANFPEHSR
jgi:hypothetical protein